ncbi:IclR family transcriptional regulator domain-containing protein [Pseudooceanicola pacificus]|nr:IclR family transcriptional regulator C-terminal domain-containing protein [Pseudooceanicola pacificus]
MQIDEGTDRWSDVTARLAARSICPACPSISRRARLARNSEDGASHIYAVRLQSKRGTFYATLVGHRLSCPQSSGGRAMLSRLPRDEMLEIVETADYFAFTSRTVLDKAEVARRIDRAREDGYAVVLEEVLMGEIAIGAAVTDSSGRPNRRGSPGRLAFGLERRGLPQPHGPHGDGGGVHIGPGRQGPLGSPTGRSRQAPWQHDDTQHRPHPGVGHLPPVELAPETGDNARRPASEINLPTLRQFAGKSGHRSYRPRALLHNECPVPGRGKHSAFRSYR